MLNLPKISEYIAELREARAARIQAQSDINAKWVLDRSIELHQKCIEENNLPTAKGVLELIGKNVSVNAFNKDSTDISFNLKEIKVIYGKLESRNISPAKT